MRMSTATSRRNQIHVLIVHVHTPNVRVLTNMYMMFSRRCKAQCAVVDLECITTSRHNQCISFITLGHTHPQWVQDESTLEIVSRGLPHDKGIEP